MYMRAICYIYKRGVSMSTVVLLVTTSCTPTIRVEGPAFSGVTTVNPPCAPCECAVRPSGKVEPRP